MDLRAGTIAILDEKGIVVGAGFVASSSGLIATCAHVIRAARSHPGVFVKLHFLCTGTVGEAMVLPEWWRDEEAGDISILRLEGALPPEATSLPLGSSDGVKFHEFSTLGFPDLESIEFVSTTGQVEGPAEENGRPLLAVKAGGVTSGFSGAPAWDELRRRVIGMVVMVAKSDSFGKMRDTAFLIPSEAVRAVCVELQPSDSCPYRSLDSFNPGDVGLYFGRQAAIDDLVDKIRILVQPVRFM